MSSTNWFRNLAIGLIITWLSVFVFFPSLVIFFTSFLTRGDSTLVVPVFTLENYKQLFDIYYLTILLHSIYMAAAATIVCLLIGYPFAYLTHKMPPQIRVVMLFLVILPFWTNSLTRVYALKMVMGFNGLFNQALMTLRLIDKPLNLMYTDLAVITGLVYLLLPFMILPLYSSIGKLDHRLLEAAQDLGASAFSRFVHVVIPQTMPGIVAGFLLVFLPALGMFYISDLLGGAKNLVIGNIIKHQFLNTRDWPGGAAIGVTLIVVMAVLIYLYYQTNRAINQKFNL